MDISYADNSGFTARMYWDPNVTLGDLPAVQGGAAPLTVRASVAAISVMKGGSGPFQPVGVDGILGMAYGGNTTDGSCSSAGTATPYGQRQRHMYTPGCEGGWAVGVWEECM